MRSIPSGVVALVLAGFVGTVVAVGCASAPDDTSSSATKKKTSKSSTEPSSDDDDDDDDTAGDGTDSAPNASTSTKDSGTGSGDASIPKKEAGAVTPVKDAGSTAPPAPKPGDTCTTDGEIFDRGCGFCGHEEAICQKGKVSVYGACQGSVTNGCTPGTTESAICGLCGTQQRQCQNDCSWAAGACTGEPANACDPGTTSYTSAGCPEANTYRSRTCQANCQQGATSECGPRQITVPATVGAVAASTITLSTSMMEKRPVPACTGVNTSPVPVDYIEVWNTQAVEVTVSIYQTPGTSGLDTIIYYYNSVTRPTTDLQLKACVKGSDSCDTALCGSGNGGLGGLKDVKIPANGKILVGSAAWSDDTGTLQLNVKRQ